MSMIEVDGSRSIRGASALETFKLGPRTRTWTCLGAVAAALLVTGEAVVVGSDDTVAAPPDTSFQKVTLNGAPGEPIGLVVLPDGRVLHTTRGGRVFLHDPVTGLNRVIASVPVYQHDEEGLQGIAIDAH